MANYKLGPVIGKIGGGGVEIVEQQITTDGPVSIPAGWGSAYAGFQGTIDGDYTRPTVLGRGNSTPFTYGDDVGGFRLMTAGQNLAMSKVQGTLTFIRID